MLAISFYQYQHAKCSNWYLAILPHCSTCICCIPWTSSDFCISLVSSEKMQFKSAVFGISLKHCRHSIVSALSALSTYYTESITVHVYLNLLQSACLLHSLILSDQGYSAITTHHEIILLSYSQINLFNNKWPRGFENLWVPSHKWNHF